MKTTYISKAIIYSIATFLFLLYFVCLFAPQYYFNSLGSTTIIIAILLLVVWSIIAMAFVYWTEYHYQEFLVAYLICVGLGSILFVIMCSLVWGSLDIKLNGAEAGAMYVISFCLYLGCFFIPPFCWKCLRKNLQLFSREIILVD